jgi:hypothetical protein
LCDSKILRRKRGSLPLKSLNSSPSPSLLFQSSCSSSPLPWIPSMLCPPLLFFDDDVEEEKEELPNELVASLKQKITALEE